MPERRIIITATSAVVEEISKREVLLDSAFEAIVPPGGYLSPELAPGVWISFLSPTTWTILCQLPEIHFATQYGIGSTKIEKDTPLQFRPMFMGSFLANAGTKLTPLGEYHGFRLTPLPNMRFWFVHTKTEGDFLLSQDTRTGHLYHPPCPNVHDDGRVCDAGNGTERLPPYASGPLLPWIEERLKTWGSRLWNGDLLGHGILDTPALARILSFDERTGTNIPYTQEWQSILAKIAPPVSVSGPLTTWSAAHTPKR